MIPKISIKKSGQIRRVIRWKPILWDINAL